MMLNTEFKAAISPLGWNGQKACQKLCINKSTLSAYKSGRYPVSPQIERLIRFELRNDENFRNTRKPLESFSYMLGG